MKFQKLPKFQRFQKLGCTILGNRSTEAHDEVFEIVAIVGNGGEGGWEDMVKFRHERADDYYGLTVEGTLVADGGDSSTAILFTSGAEEWARKPGDWRGIEASP